MDRIEHRITKAPSEKTAQSVTFLAKVSFAFTSRGSGMAMIIRSVKIFSVSTKIK